MCCEVAPSELTAGEPYLFVLAKLGVRNYSEAFGLLFLSFFAGESAVPSAQLIRPDMTGTIGTQAANSSSAVNLL